MSAPEASFLDFIVGRTPEVDEAPPPAGVTGPAARYRRAFALHELEAQPALQWFFGALLLGFFVTFWEWSGESGFTLDAVARDRHRCWPHFQSCGDYYFLRAMPLGYSQTLVYMGLFVLIFVAAVAALRQRWVLAHALMLVLFAWKVLIYFVLSMAFMGNYHTFHLVFALIFLFAPYKLFFLRRVLVLLYFFAASIKIHEGWILGTYFTSMRTGIPLFPEVMTPLLTNGVIALETFGAPLLLSRRRTWQRGAFIAFIFFHLYSGVLVKYMYPTMCLPPVLILFGPRYRTMRSPLTLRALPGWATMLLCALGQSVSFLIPGDVKLTLEGNYYGLYMFEANHQCQSSATVSYKDGGDRLITNESAVAHRRCDPYGEWFRLHALCRRERSKIASVQWTFDHSINGGPFYRIVDVADACAIEYRPFKHNEWIQLPGAGARKIGVPVKNYYE